jgi:hypothetical protein
MPPKVFVVCFVHASCVAVSLTWITAADEVGLFKPFTRERRDIVPPLDFAPVFCQHTPTEKVFLYLPHTPHSGTIKAKI